MSRRCDPLAVVVQDAFGVVSCMKPMSRRCDGGRRKLPAAKGLHLSFRELSFSDGFKFSKSTLAGCNLPESNNLESASAPRLFVVTAPLAKTGSQ
jgi:hypothetical protein